jgi:hypothetical protein
MFFFTIGVYDLLHLCAWSLFSLPIIFFLKTEHLLILGNSVCVLKKRIFPHSFYLLISKKYYNELLILFARFIVSLKLLLLMGIFLKRGQRDGTDYQKTERVWYN